MGNGTTGLGSATLHFLRVDNILSQFFNQFMLVDSCLRDYNLVVINPNSRADFLCAYGYAKVI
jgi:hypothetical protein